MGYGLDAPSTTRVDYLKTAGLHENAKLVNLVYTATEEWEGFDIEIVLSDGRFFKERTFGPSIDKVYVKGKWKSGVKVGEETKEEALERVEGEISDKIYYLVNCFVPKEDIDGKFSSVSNLKELVDAAVGLISIPNETPINFLTIWKNSDTRQKSNMIIADRIRWCEPHTEGKPATIRLSNYQLANQVVEKYPYRSDNESSGTDNALIEGGDNQPADDLPF